MRGADRTLWLTEDGLWVTVFKPAGESNQLSAAGLSSLHPLEVAESPMPQSEAVHLKLSFAGANRHPRLEPFDRLEGHLTYMISSDWEEWQPDVPMWGGVRYVDLYPGLDLEIRGGDSWSWRLVARTQAADLGAVRLRLEGADRLTLDGDRDSAGRSSIGVSTALGEFALPLLGIGSANPCEGRRFAYTPSQGLTPQVKGDQVIAPFAEEGLTSSGTDSPTQALDMPEDLLYATFLGGRSDDYGDGIAVDGSGKVYVTAWNSVFQLSGGGRAGLRHQP